MPAPTHCNLPWHALFVNAVSATCAKYAVQRGPVNPQTLRKREPGLPGQPWKDMVAHYAGAARQKVRAVKAQKERK